MADRQGIEIDYCPNCRGVWLDRGELDKIIDRSASYTKNPDADYEEGKKNYPNAGSSYNDPHYKHKKRKGFLGDFFDFD